MKATISKGELKFALNAVCKTASNAAANLACVLIDARDAVMRFETNDGVCASKYESLALIDEPGRLLLPANYLSDIVGDLPDEAIGVSSDGTGCILSYGKSSVRISGLDPDEFQGFPPLKPEHTATIKAETFSGMVKMCAKFASKNNERPIFCCINVSAKDGDLTMRATDSYRLVEVADTAQAGSGEFVCNLPARFAVQFASSFQTGDVDMAVAGNQIILSSGPLTCMTRAVEGNYPDFTRFFATEYGNVAVFERHEAIPVIKRAKTVGRWSHEALRLSLCGRGCQSRAVYLPSLALSPRTSRATSFFGRACIRERVCCVSLRRVQCNAGRAHRAAHRKRDSARVRQKRKCKGRPHADTGCEMTRGGREKMVPLSLVIEQVAAYRYAFQEACRLANEAIRQRDEMSVARTRCRMRRA